MLQTSLSISHTSQVVSIVMHVCAFDWSDMLMSWVLANNVCIYGVRCHRAPANAARRIPTPQECALTSTPIPHRYPTEAHCHTPQIRTGGWPALQHTGGTSSSGHAITRNPSSWWSSYPHWQHCCCTKTTMVSESRLPTGRAQGQGLWHHPWHFAWIQVAIRFIRTNSFFKSPWSFWRPTPRRGGQTSASGNYAGMYMSFKNVFTRDNDLKRPIYVEQFLSD